MTSLGIRNVRRVCRQMNAAVCCFTSSASRTCFRKAIHYDGPDGVESVEQRRGGAAVPGGSAAAGGADTATAIHGWRRVRNARSRKCSHHGPPWQLDAHPRC
jgi:hypothetical protein